MLVAGVVPVGARFRLPTGELTRVRDSDPVGKYASTGATTRKRLSEGLERSHPLAHGKSLGQRASADIDYKRSREVTSCQEVEYGTGNSNPVRYGRHLSQP